MSVVVWLCGCVHLAYQASLEDCLTKRDSARTEVARLTEELKESKKQTRTTEAKVRYSSQYLVLL